MLCMAPVPVSEPNMIGNRLPTWRDAGRRGISGHCAGDRDSQRIAAPFAFPALSGLWRGKGYM